MNDSEDIADLIINSYKSGLRDGYLKELYDVMRMASLDGVVLLDNILDLQDEYVRKTV